MPGKRKEGGTEFSTEWIPEEAWASEIRELVQSDDDSSEGATRGAVRGRVGRGPSLTAVPPKRAAVGEGIYRRSEEPTPPAPEDQQ